MDLSYTIDKEEWNEKVAILRLVGQLDRAFHPEMEDALQSVIDSGYRHIAVDLEKLEYLSSAGIAAMVNLKGKLDRVTGSLCFFAPTPRVSKVLDVMGLKRVYPFYETADDAKENFLKP